MPRFSANLGFLFPELPFEERFAAAAALGFAGVEYATPYGHEKEKLCRLLRDHGLLQVLINSPAGPREDGGRGLACQPGRSGEFRDSIELALDYAEALECPRIHLLAGVAPADADFDSLQATYMENLRFAARAGAERGVKMLIEGINRNDAPGYFLDRPSLARRMLEEIAVPNLFLQFDVYHAQMTEGNLAETIEAALPLIEHIQIADVPGRHQPGSGEINFPFLFHRLDDLGYQGWVGCEFHPDGSTVGSLAWLAEYREKLNKVPADG